MRYDLAGFLTFVILDAVVLFGLLVWTSSSKRRTISAKGVAFWSWFSAWTFIWGVGRDVFHYLRF
jgi:hypothetical protein